jgi:hypothetical protein
MLKYIELKDGSADNGPAWIARVVLSRSGRTVYFNGKALHRANAGSSGNHFDAETGQSYWVSGVKRRGSNRHWAGSGFIQIEASAVAEYLELTGTDQLDRSQFRVVPDLPSTDPAHFVEPENQSRT